jgi:hypothetical protein
MLGHPRPRYAVRAEGVGGWFYRASGVYQPPNFALRDGRHTMLVSTLLRFQGDAIAQLMRKRGVPTVIVNGWMKSWAMLTADADEEGASVTDICTRLLALMAVAQVLYRPYDRG